MSIFEGRLILNLHMFLSSSGITVRADESSCKLSSSSSPPSPSGRHRRRRRVTLPMVMLTNPSCDDDENAEANMRSGSGRRRTESSSSAEEGSRTAMTVVAAAEVTQAPSTKNEMPLLPNQMPPSTSTPTPQSTSQTRTTTQSTRPRPRQVRAMLVDTITRVTPATPTEQEEEGAGAEQRKGEDMGEDGDEEQAGVGQFLHPLQSIVVDDGDGDDDDAIASVDPRAGSQRHSDVSLYQQQKRVRLSIPCEPHDLSSPSGGGGGVPPPASELWADPSDRSNIFKRRSAVHGLSPNTGLSIGAVM